MSANNPYIFILLREYFDELLAVTLITRLRREGLRTKVVGQRGLQPVKGKHGLGLTPDLRLDEAQRLTDDDGVAGMIALGFSSDQAKNDPRVDNLLRTIADQSQSFLAGERDMVLEISNSGLVCPATPEGYLDFAKFLSAIALTPMKVRDE